MANFCFFFSFFSPGALVFFVFALVVICGFIENWSHKCRRTEKTSAMNWKRVQNWRRREGKRELRMDVETPQVEWIRWRHKIAYKWNNYINSFLGSFFRRFFIRVLYYKNFLNEDTWNELIGKQKKVNDWIVTQKNNWMCWTNKKKRMQVPKNLVFSPFFSSSLNCMHFPWVFQLLFLLCFTRDWTAGC